MKIAIVVCCNKDWLPFSCATLITAARNTKADVDLYLLGESVVGKHEKDIIRKAGQIIGRSIAVEQFDSSLLAHISPSWYNKSTLYRLLLNEVIPKDYQRVLYLDSDTLVLRSIDSLLFHNLEGMPAGAIEDLGLNTRIFSEFATSHRQSINFSESEFYFNAGVLLLDWQKVTFERLLPKAMRILENEHLELADQDALNIAFRQRCKSLSLRLNVMNLAREFIPNPIIRHFTNGEKPWEANYMPEDRVYRSRYRVLLHMLGCREILSTSLARDRYDALAESVAKVRSKAHFFQKLVEFLDSSGYKFKKQKSELSINGNSASQPQFTKELENYISTRLK